MAIKFLTECGQISSEIRAEFILLSDVLGLSALVDSMNHPVVPPATEATVLGPFFTEDATVVSLADQLALDRIGSRLTLGFGLGGRTGPIWRVDRVRGQGRVHVLRGQDPRY